ncbi:MAG: hypothetical protein CL943_00145 [Candidatus Diapherotrites archaeon]|uniref:Uncharacterized protein n=1 Tax=Candidatus Iainarchaeum sp. TaxID=3101447 RepID=A0A2D6LZW4_9ARCH|nr:hypothetical protein [Candidatus Diapherotrites archaeon]|tara:strand:+ start:2844 stop:3377 length:534 start_codon:yes stop_codon:yes gene_type:complete
MRAVSLFVLVLVLVALFGETAFAITCSNYIETTTTGTPNQACWQILAEGDCPNYYSILSTGPVASGRRCGWRTGTGKCRQESGTNCYLKYTIGGKHTSTPNCANQTNYTDCVVYFQPGTPSKFCWWANPTLGCGTTGANVCVPEFIGIEFNEMEVSTGIIALLAAIVLPTFLFRKKK